MANWLDNILRDVQAEANLPVPVAPSEQEKIRNGIMAMFDTALDVFERARASDIPIATSVYWPTREASRLVLQTMSAPQVTFPLDRATSITIRVTLRTGLTYPDVISQAKWRCILVANSQEVDNKLFDNRNSMARWVLAQLIAFQPGPVVPPFPPTGTPRAEAPAAPEEPDSDLPSREHRIIMVDRPSQ